jgi:hypothetical protein
MAEQSTTANKRSNVVLRRTLPALTAALTVWALVSSFFALDVTEYGLVSLPGVWSVSSPSPASTSLRHLTVLCGCKTHPVLRPAPSNF